MELDVIRRKKEKKVKKKEHKYEYTKDARTNIDFPVWLNSGHLNSRIQSLGFLKRLFRKASR